jgi:hypothetical protein
MFAIDGPIKYNYATRFRIQAMNKCMAHNTQRANGHFLEPLLQNSGLGRNCETGQNLYRMDRYMKKLKDFILFCQLQSNDGDIANLKDKAKVPACIRNAFGTFSRTRWLSQENQCVKACELLRLVANDQLVQLIAEMYGGVHTDEFEEAMRHCVCLDSDEPSAFILTLLWVANHAPGGQAGEGHTNLGDLVTFLCTPLHRMCLVYGAEFHPIHLKILAFF